MWIISKAMHQTLAAQDCGNLPCSQAEAAESLPDAYLAGEPSAPWKSNPTLKRFWLRARTTELSTLSRFGMTFALSTADLGADSLTLCLVDFLAKTFRQQENKRALMENAADFGEKCPELLAKYDQDSRTLKTPQIWLDLGWSKSWLILPRWGTMQNGMCFQRQIGRAHV